jgi:type VI protein secretion system component VasK
MRRFGLLLQRILVMAFASLACVWLVAGLLASRELERADDLAESAFTQRFSEAQLVGAIEDLERTRRWGVDDGSLFAEIALLVVTGRRYQALRVNRRLVRLQPERFEAWQSLYVLTVDKGRKRANAARRRALELNPHASGLLLPGSSG